MDDKKILKVRSVFFLGGGQVDFGTEIRTRTRHIRLLDDIQEITDPAELPEYLSDTDLSVAEAAELKLRELTEIKNG